MMGASTSPSTRLNRLTTNMYSNMSSVRDFTIRRVKGFHKIESKTSTANSERKIYDSEALSKESEFLNANDKPNYGTWMSAGYAMEEAEATWRPTGRCTAKEEKDNIQQAKARGHYEESVE
mmetsp:Transcript_11826/g.19205  ORF Transcript_11826/g.19205 Transcript_11826/m.19205 type:complete len:121 (-) Transcript_11826:182-544(-)